MEELNSVENQVVQAAFSLGSVPVEAPWQKRQRILRVQQIEALERKRKNIAKNKDSSLRKNAKPKPMWRIYPDSLLSLGARIVIDSLQGDTYIKKLDELSQKRKSYVSSDPIDIIKHKKLYDEAYYVLISNQQLRYLFKRIYLFWKVARLPAANEEDPITLFPPSNPVIIHSLKNGVKYIFEASSIARDIHKKLLHSRLQIPAPLFPRNPLTNEEFTLAQTVSLCDQCKAAGQTYWTVEAFYDLMFDISKFSLEYNRKLRLNAIESILNNPDDCDFFDILADFIEDQHYIHRYHMNEPLYNWCLVKIPKNDIIQNWKNLCKSWYKSDIMIDDEYNKQLVFDKIMDETKILCTKFKDLIVARKLFLKY